MAKLHLRYPLSTIGYGLGLLSLLGCQAAPSGAEDVKSSSQPIIYGSDDRTEPYAYNYPSWVANARQFTVALMQHSTLDESDPNNVQILAPTLGEKKNLCSDQRFIDQPLGAYCSGTLIAPDLVLTAGHCAEAVACSDTNIVFDYTMTAPGSLGTLTSNQVYACAQVVVSKVELGVDYAILRLDRPAIGRTPAPVKQGYTPIAVGTALRVNGHPEGLPLKIADGATVHDNRAWSHDYFTQDLDIFPGNSGSGVFSAITGKLEGVAVRSIDRNGNYVASESGCYRTRVLPNDFFDQGQVTYVSQAIDGLCRAESSNSLCSCGDGTCDAALNENSVTCAQDCGQVCGDGRCNGAENATNCYDDCGRCGNGVCESHELQAGNCCMDCAPSAPLECPSRGQAARPRFGDVDADGLVTNTDATLVAAYATGANGPIALDAADVDCDGDIDIQDALRIGQYSQGLLQRFGCEEIVGMALGARHTCVLQRSGDVRCWGLNWAGQLGYGNTESLGDQPSETPSRLGNVATGGKVVRIDSGPLRTCAIFDTASVRCWGYGDSIGYTIDQFPGGNVGDDETPARYGDLRIGTPVKQMGLGMVHACALEQSGAVGCWGWGDMGQNGYGLGFSVGYTTAPGAAGPLPLGGAVTELAPGFLHTCALRDTGSVRCWGLGLTGALGYGSTQTVGDDETLSTVGDLSIGGAVQHVVAGDFHNCALLTSGAVRCWGMNDKGQLGYGNTQNVGDDELPSSRPVLSLGGKATQVVAGSAFSCALLESGDVRCWGDNTFGQLGTGNTIRIGDDELPSSVPVIALGGKVRKLAASGNHACALTTSGDLRCWGENADGRLGYGNTLNIGDDETPASAGNVPFLPQAATSCTDATTIDLGAQQVAKTVPANACIKVTQYPGSWVHKVVLQTQAGGSGYPIGYSFSNCSSFGSNVLGADWQSSEVAPVSNTCTTRIRLQGPEGGSVILKWWATG